MRRKESKHIFQQAVKIGNYLQLYAIKECKIYTKDVIYVKLGLGMIFFFFSNVFPLVSTDSLYPLFT